MTLTLPLGVHLLFRAAHRSGEYRDLLIDELADGHRSSGEGSAENNRGVCIQTAPHLRSTNETYCWETEMNVRLTRLMAAIMALSLVAAACGSDGSTDTATTTAAAAGTTEAPAAETETTEAAPAETETTEMMEEAAEDPGTIVDAAVAAGDFTTSWPQSRPLASLKPSADPVPLLSSPRPTRPAAALEALGMTAEDACRYRALTQVLTYHVLAGEVPSSTVVTLNGESVATLNGADITITVDGDAVMINDANVTAVDIMASNGIIHVIDAVLYPRRVSIAGGMDVGPLPGIHHPLPRMTIPPRYNPTVSTVDHRQLGAVETAFVRGDEHALRAVYDAHGSLIYTFCKRALGDDHASDVTQEVFVSAWRARSQFDPAKGSLAAWLTGIAKNRIIDHFRTERRHAAEPHDERRSESPVEAEVDQVGDRLVVADALRTLPERSRHVIELAYLSDLTHAEIATKTALPLGTVKSDIRRGLASIRRHLEHSND
ncbi:MAG: sigma-70 family RNA polymerase sigma factor [Acidimicrobiales bacterium]